LGLELFDRLLHHVTQHRPHATLLAGLKNAQAEACATKARQIVEVLCLEENY
jgi:hypothetical protein